MSTLKNASKNSWDKCVNEIHPEEDLIRSFSKNGTIAKSTESRFIERLHSCLRRWKTGLVRADGVEMRTCPHADLTI